MNETLISIQLRRLIFLFLPCTDLIDVILETGSFSEPNNSGRWCSTGQNIQVNISGFQKATFGEKLRNTSSRLVYT